MRQGHRQEVLNTVLADLLRDRGVISTPESVVAPIKEKARDIPDILVKFQGLRTAIECEVADQRKAEERAIESARDRVSSGIAHIGVAIVYPGSLRQTDYAELRSHLQSCDLRFAVVTESDETPFATGDVNQLESILRQTFSEIVKEDVVSQAVAALDAGIERFASATAAKTGLVQRMAQALGIRELPPPRKQHKRNSK